MFGATITILQSPVFSDGKIFMLYIEHAESKTVEMVLSFNVRPCPVSKLHDSALIISLSAPSRRAPTVSLVTLIFVNLPLLEEESDLRSLRASGLDIEEEEESNEAEVLCVDWSITLRS